MNQLMKGKKKKEKKAPGKHTTLQIMVTQAWNFFHFFMYFSTSLASLTDLDHDGHNNMITAEDITAINLLP